jgi:hypothetical protein
MRIRFRIRIPKTSVADPGCLSRIPDPTFFHLGSRILVKELKYLTPKKAKKWFRSSKKYDPGCSSRIPDPDADFLPSRIPDPGVKKSPNPGSGSAILPKTPFKNHLKLRSGAFHCGRERVERGAGGEGQGSLPLAEGRLLQPRPGVQQGPQHCRHQAARQAAAPSQGGSRGGGGYRAQAWRQG